MLHLGGGGLLARTQLVQMSKGRGKGGGCKNTVFSLRQNLTPPILKKNNNPRLPPPCSVKTTRKMITFCTFFQLFFSKTDFSGRTFCFLPHSELPLPASSVWQGEPGQLVPRRLPPHRRGRRAATAWCRSFGLRKSGARPVRAQPLHRNAKKTDFGILKGFFYLDAPQKCRK